MNKRLLHTLLLLLAISATAGAQDYGKMSHTLRQRVAAAKGTKSHGGAMLQGLLSTTSDDASDSSDSQLFAFVKGSESAVTDHCIAHQGEGDDMIHIVVATLDELSEMSDDSRVQRIESEPHVMSLLNDSTAKVIGATEAWQKAVPQSIGSGCFDGSGVLVGVVDAGLDYHHPTFRSADGTRLRIKRVWDMLDGINSITSIDKTSSFPFGKLLTTEDDILNKKYSTDSNLMNHGTHTSAIAAGSGYPSIYSGMAPGADIYLTNAIFSDNSSCIDTDVKDILNKAYQSTDFLLFLAFQNIFNYADSLGMPCVINLSAGSYDNIAYDSDLHREYLRHLTGPGKIIVASAGNVGALQQFMYNDSDHHLTGGKISKNSSYAGIELSITTTGPVTVQLTNETTGKTDEFYLDFSPGNTEQYSPTGLQWNAYSIWKSAEYNDSVEILSYHDVYNGDRVGYDVYINEGSKDAFNNSTYTVSVITAGDTDARTYIKYGELTSYSADLPGAEEGGTVFEPGSMPNVICVGATGWRQQYTDINGSTTTSSEWKGLGKRAKFSSIGPSYSGETKPDVMAPGIYITSAYNKRYRDTHTSATSSIIEKNTYTLPGETKEQTCYWRTMSGTSMAAPAVTGTVALWLQAKPTLTPEDVKDIIARTATIPDETLDYPNNYYGYGEINAYAGLLDACNLLAITDLSHSNYPLIAKRLQSNCIAITITPENRATAVRLYNISGLCVGHYEIPAGQDSLEIPLDGLSGIIAVQVDGHGSQLIRI